jgi:hypothetical protein
MPESKIMPRETQKFLPTLPIQLLLLTPLYWFVEILQNLAYKILLGQYGWYYPLEQFHWFSFRTLPSWAIALTVMAAFYHYVFIPKNIPLWKTYILTGTICWAMEWINGYLHNEILETPLYIWTYSPLKYVGIEAIFLWWADVCLYHYLRKKIIL